LNRFIMYNKIAAAYEQLADGYNARIDEKPHNAFYDRPNTLSLIPEPAGKHILDAACGPGKYAEILLSQGAQVTGFDLIPRMVALAQQRNKGQGHFFAHDMSQPLHMLEEATFDVVLCALGMDYLEDWDKPLREFYRVLKPGGHLVMSMQHPFFEYLFFESKRYFDTEAVQCTWKGFGKPVEVHSFRRPLSAFIMPLLNSGFQLDTLLEPLPVDAFKAADPRHYEELMQFPAFICVRARKA
jgi:ubiquinone/menaquinone biosynthesis C-methylase UbiE